MARESFQSELFQKLQLAAANNPNMVKDDDQTLKALVSGLSLDDPANQAVHSDRMEELSRPAEAKLLRSRHPVAYNHNAPGVGLVLTVGEYVEPTDEDDSESGLQVFWGEILLGTIEATERKGVPGLSCHWHKEEGENDRSWFRRALQLDLDEQETVRVQYLLRLACYDLLKARQDDEEY